MFAHSSKCEGQPWEPLEDHLLAVASRAAGFCDAFGARELGRLAGGWHDLGKSSLAFQRYVLGAYADEADSDFPEDDANPLPTRVPRKRVDHSTAGAQHAERTLPAPFNNVLAYAIAAHHGRLPDWDAAASDATLPKRLAKRIEPLQTLEAVPLSPADPPALISPDYKIDPDRQAFQLALLTRMIYSALVDADRLETERYYFPDRAALRPGKPSPPAELLRQLDHFIVELRAKRQGDLAAPVDRHRDAVLADCRSKATLPPGVFSLTVPTGGGKTLASMAFALTHAAHHGHRRVLYALPYTSIIEQTAATFSQVFTNPDDVLEHHSNFDTAARFDDTRRRSSYEMAAENFDATVIVTTNVQLFESLFSAHRSTCRKLHRLAGSVIVLDEAQCIPPRLLRPTLAVLEELVRNYRCTLVLCTATQPAITVREEFPIGMSGVTEIVDHPQTLYAQMKRVAVQDLGPCEDDALAARIAGHDAALCIVNTRRHAAELTRLTREAGAEDVIHLSAAMCPAHRRTLVQDIKARLADKAPCRVVSTQVIEAGVDVDFPAVYRAIAGFDSIAQAAGRCNREGRSAVGEVYVFETHHKPAMSMLDSVSAARALFPDHRDPLALDAIEAYFRRVYWSEGQKGQRPWDTKDVMGSFTCQNHNRKFICAFNFRQAEERFRWIDSVTTTIIVPYGDGQQLIDRIRLADEPDWTLLRQAQQFGVAVYGPEFDKLLQNQTISPYFDGCVWVLNRPEAYDPVLGLRVDIAGMDPDFLASC